MSHSQKQIEFTEKVNEMDNEMDISYENIKEDKLDEYDRRLRELKEEIKTLKKLKRRQKKINKLEEEKMDVLREIERRKNSAQRRRKHH